eukprot:COSAG06_NODE_774_length_12424_cov_35.268014_7_plen_59_part_00
MASNTPTRGAERGGKTPGCSGVGGMTFFAARCHDAWVRGRGRGVGGGVAEAKGVAGVA